MRIELQFFGGRGQKSNTTPPAQNTEQNPVQPITAAQIVASAPPNYQVITDQDAQDIIDQHDELYNINNRLAIKQYISAADTGNGYSMSQNLNYALENDLPLSANEKYIDTHMTSAMHDIGKDSLLTRGAHSDVISALGAGNYQSMTDAQLNAALTGASWTSKGFTSTSYDVTKNPFLSGAQSGGREVVMNIKAKSSTKVVFGAKAQAEVVIAKGTKFNITGAHFTGKTVYPRVGGAKKQIVIDVEVE